VDWSARGAGADDVAPQWRDASGAGTRVGPASAGERLASNLAALRTLRTIQAEDRPATPREQDVLARWTSWGALKEVFDEQRDRHRGTREELLELLSPQEYSEARRTVLNAHFTDPRLVEEVWGAVKALGFEGGHVLEPGAGAGGFIGLAPESASMVGIELDGVSADIAAALYPSSVVRHESFADTHLPMGSFEAAVGNVPFGNYQLHDRLHNAGRHSIHNHFIVKSLDLVRPGGLVAVLTSRFTLDSLDASARREMYDRADLVTAVRLPSGAHLELAGTEAVTDLLVLRVRPEGAEPGESTWLHTVPVQVLDEDGAQSELPLNAWFEANPQLVLGEAALGHGMHGAATMTITRDAQAGPVHEDLRAVLAEEVTRAVSDELAMTPAEPAEAAERAALLDELATAPKQAVAEAGDASRLEGFLRWDESQARFTRLVTGVQRPLEVPRAQIRPLRALLELRDTQLALLESEAASGADSEDLATLRTRLNEQYDAYVEAYGPINSVKVTESTRLDRHGEPVRIRRKPAVMKTFDNDPFSGAVRGLELYDEGTDTAQKAAVFARRVVNRVETPDSADTPADALAIVLDAAGEVRLDQIAALLGVEEDEARQQLGDLVFDDPATGKVLTRAEYLYGTNVRQALRVAQEAALERPELAVNVEALRAVLPRDLTPAEISAHLGAVWIPASDVQDFLRETTGDRSVVVEHPGGALWNVRGGNRGSVAATSTWGTERMNSHVIVERLMEQKPIVVTDVYTDADGRERRVVNPVESAAAQEKAEQLAERFSEWVWSDPARSQRLAAEYNEAFNAIVLRDYTADGERLTLPGLAANFTPHAHQRTAVARMIAEPSVGLYHGVGAGKTAEMVMGAMELRRLGLVDKPTVVVPNHMLEQVSREWMQLYPRARLLAAASEDLRGERRQQFVGRAAMGEWDGIVLTHKAFELLPVAKQTEVAYVENEVAKLRASRDRARAADMSAHTVQQIERSVAAMEERLKAKLDRPRDRGLTFEQTGIDYLIVDELHLFKNLGVTSNITEMNRQGSQRASDLDMKVTWLRERAEERAAERGHTRARVMTGATATPIANSVSEAWVMQKYLRPDLLEQAGITDFDSWAATFGTLVTELELTPEGGYRQKSRFARFDNLPELLLMWHVSADVKTPDQLDLNIPKIIEREDGQRAPQTSVVPASPELGQFMQSLAARAERLRASGAPRGKGEDNMLVVTSDGRKAALDLRMLDRSQHEPVASTPSKVDQAAERIHRIWTEHRDTVYDVVTPAGDVEPHPVPGALQIVFCDLGTPASSSPAQHETPWSFYVELREQLTAAGMDPARIRFVQDANNSERKARLFAACRAGEVDVVIGSTETMGVGTNVQQRAVALHHIDCPWRPADVEQREGRILRQLNQNPEVQVIRYVTEGSFDAYSWQTVERKQRFISQMMNGSLETRGAEDIASSQTLSFSEVKALASGNPLILERAQAEQDVVKLDRLARAHARNQQHRQFTITTSERTEAELEALLEPITALIESRTSTQGDAFRATIAGQSTHERATAATLLADLVRPHAARLAADAAYRDAQAGEVVIGATPFALTVTRTFAGPQLVATMPGLDARRISLDVRDVTSGGLGPITRLENRIAGLDRLLEETRHDLETTRSERAEAREGLGAPFPRTGDLEEAKARLQSIDRQLQAMTKAQDQPTSDEGDSAESVAEPVGDSPESPAPDGAARERFRAAHEKLRQHRGSPAAGRTGQPTPAGPRPVDRPRETERPSGPRPPR
jgi:N12 class adenine-specific DNA methylase